MNSRVPGQILKTIDFPMSAVNVGCAEGGRWMNEVDGVVHRRVLDPGCMKVQCSGEHERRGE